MNIGLGDNSESSCIRPRGLLLGGLLALAFALPCHAQSVDKDSHRVEMKAVPCSAGKECKVEIQLTAKGDFRINDKFPIKFRAAEPFPEGLTYAKALVKREEGKFEEKKGSLPVAFTFARAGKATIAGTFSYSVCSEANCLIDKVELSLDVDVK